MYWKKKLTQSTNTANRLTSLKGEQGTLAPRYEMSSKKARPPIPHAPTAVQTTAKGTYECGPLYESTEPIDYAEMS